MKSLGCAGLAVLTALLVSAQPTLAGKKQDITFRAIVIAPPIIVPVHQTPSGNARVEYAEVQNMVLSATPLVTGFLTWEGYFNLNAHAEGAQTSATGSGTGVFQVGSWDPEGNFTPSGGVFVTKWEFKGYADGAFELKVIGHGVAGEVEGMQFDVQSRGPSLVVYDCTGQLLDPKAGK